tara:strand:+ start:126 stop:431 length:306 start_codon:yes stop_codon:yes gene_type:complete
MKISKEQLTDLVKEALDKLTPEQQQLIQEDQALSEEKAKLNKKKYGKVYNRLDRLLKLTKCGAPSILLANELRMLSEFYSEVHPEIKTQVEYTGLFPEIEV